jgi:hypothetical protein
VSLFGRRVLLAVRYSPRRELVEEGRSLRRVMLGRGCCLGTCRIYSGWGLTPFEVVGDVALALGFTLVFCVLLAIFYDRSAAQEES